MKPSGRKTYPRANLSERLFNVFIGPISKIRASAASIGGVQKRGLRPHQNLQKASSPETGKIESWRADTSETVEVEPDVRMVVAPAGGTDEVVAVAPRPAPQYARFTRRRPQRIATR